MVKTSVRVIVTGALLLILPWARSSFAEEEEAQQTTIVEQSAAEGAAEPEVCAIPKNMSDIGCGQCAYENGFRFSDLNSDYTPKGDQGFSVKANDWKNGDIVLVL